MPVHDPQTWHHGLIAEWWAEFNDDFRPHEVPYFRGHVERGQPALDVACGTGRVLLPLVRDGLDVDGCDVSADMIAACRTKAAHDGLAPTLWVQPMHEVDPPRHYRTIIVGGAFGLGSSREQDAEALRRFRACLEPDGTLVLDIELPYADSEQWQYWPREGRAALPEPPGEPRGRRRAPNGAEYSLRSRTIDLDPLEQRVTLSMRAERWRDGALEAEEERVLTIGVYFRNDVLLMLERAGFEDVVVEGDHNGRPPTDDDDFLVFVARP